MNTKSVITIVSFALLIFSAIAAATISVDKTDKGSVIIAELDNPAVYDFAITSTRSENIEVFTLLGIPLSPRGSFEIPVGLSHLEVRAYPPEQVRRVTGPYTFEYQIKGESFGLFKDTLSLTVVRLKDALMLEESELKPRMQSLPLTIKNTQNTHLTNLQLELSSAFFEVKQTLSLKPYESVTISVPVDAEKSRALTAGKYLISAKVSLENARSSVEGVLNYKEQKEVTQMDDTSGWILQKKVITRTNTGNVATKDTLNTNRDILTRLFTAHSLQPTSIDRHSLYVTYQWARDLQPGESWTVTTTTNYTFPFILLLLVASG